MSAPDTTRVDAPIDAVSVPRTRSRPTRPSPTARSRGTRRRSSSCEARAGGARGLGYTLRRPRDRAADRRHAAPAWSRARRAGRRRRAWRAMVARDPQPRAPRHRVDGDRRGRRRAVGPQGAAARSAARATARRGRATACRSTAAAASPRYAIARPAASSSPAGCERASRASR